jgi:hypothetical protein
MAKIRKIGLGSGATATTSFHGFNVDAEGNLVYTKASSGDVDIQNSDQIEEYVMYEVGVVGSTYKIDDNGDLIIEYDGTE